jgi:hypothetical protein
MSQSQPRTPEQLRARFQEIREIIRHLRQNFGAEEYVLTFNQIARNRLPDPFSNTADAFAAYVLLYRFAEIVRDGLSQAEVLALLFAVIADDQNAAANLIYEQD